MELLLHHRRRIFYFLLPRSAAWRTQTASCASDPWGCGWLSSWHSPMAEGDRFSALHRLAMGCILLAASVKTSFNRSDAAALRGPAAVVGNRGHVPDEGTSRPRPAAPGWRPRGPGRALHEDLHGLQAIKLHRGLGGCLGSALSGVGGGLYGNRGSPGRPRSPGQGVGLRRRSR